MSILQENESSSINQRENEQCCIICREELNVKKKRHDTILKFSKLRKIGDLNKCLELKSKEWKIEILIYGKCRKRFTGSRKIDSEFIPRKRLRSSLGAFSWKTLFLLW